MSGPSRATEKISREVESLVLSTELPDVELRHLTASDASIYYALVDRSRDHLTRFGDYHELAASTLQDIADYFSAPPDRNVRMGIWSGPRLVGRVDLNPAPVGFVLGYWLGQGQTGRGYATVSCRALIDYGVEALSAKDFWAGVTHGNQKSVAVLERLGFSFVERLEHHTRFHLQVS